MNRPLRAKGAQIIFGTAADIPTFFIKVDTDNLLLRDIIFQTERVRPSRRYPGYLRIHNFEYQLALLRILRKDGADLVEMFGSQETLEDLELRLRHPEQFSAFGKLTYGILAGTGTLKPCEMKADEFNSCAEKFYREDLRKKHIAEAIDFLEQDIFSMRKSGTAGDLHYIADNNDPAGLLKKVQEGIFNEDLPLADLRAFIYLVLSVIGFNKRQAEMSL